MGTYDQFKTDIYQGINDTPRQATATEASNGSDLIHKMNGLCDRLDLVSPSTWGKNYILIDGINGNDQNSGLDYDQQIKTVERLQELIISKKVDDVLEIILTNIDIEYLNLNGIQLSKNNEIVLNNIYGTFNIVRSVNSNTLFVTGAPSNLNLTLYNIFAKVQKPIRFYDLHNLKFVGCSFNAEADYNDVLLQAYGIKECNFEYCSFNGNAQSNDSSTLLSISGIKDCNFNSVSFYNSTANALEIDHSDVTFGEYIELDMARIATGLFPIFLRSSTIDNRNINLTNQIIRTEQCSFNQYSPKPNIEKSYFWFFPSLSNVTIPLIQKTTFSGGISELLITDTEGVATYNLKVDENEIAGIRTGNDYIAFDLDDSNNYCSPNSGKTISLEITGSATNISVQVITVEYVKREGESS